MKRLQGPVLALTMLVGNAPARTWVIEADGTGDAPTIQAGIDSAATGDSVVVAAGFYDENLDMRTKSLVLRSLSGADVTVIDGGQRDRVLSMRSGVVDGLTLQRGACDQCDGGGILIFPSTSAVIRNCIIQNNVAGFAPKGGTGGGIFMAAPTVVENCVVRDNYAGTAGGGLFDYNDVPTVVRNNIIQGNSTEYGGGGLYGNLTQVLNNLFVDNVSSGGGGGIQECAEIRGNTIVRNVGGAAGGIFSGAVLSHNIVALNQGVGVRLIIGGPAYPDCNDIWGNTTNVANWSGTGNGNFSADPLFCGAEQDNFQLADFSPCLPANNTCAALIGARGAGCSVSDVHDARGFAGTLHVSPNPSRTHAAITYSFSAGARSGHLAVYDLRGRLVARPNLGKIPQPGSVVWDGRDTAGVPVSAGVYIVRLETDRSVLSRKMVWVR